MKNAATKKTITDNTVDPDILSYTVGDDPVIANILSRSKRMFPS